jgi:hypothetical protein
MNPERTKSDIFPEKLRPSTVPLPEASSADLHFDFSSRAWRQNKREIFIKAGSSGSFDYATPELDCELYSQSSSFLELGTNMFYQEVDRNSLSRIQVERRTFVSTRSNYFKNRLPRELEAIREQAAIPIFMDRLPLRKCRTSTPYPSS